MPTSPFYSPGCKGDFSMTEFLSLLLPLVTLVRMSSANMGDFANGCACRLSPSGAGGRKPMRAE